jgi:hypothetical protein
MVKLIINKTFVDLSPDFVYEIKQPHPISSGLSNVYTAYSSDITLPLTSTNIAVFDYSLRKDSSQVHKTLEGYLIRSNGVTNVDVIVRTFTKTGIKIYIVEKISESVKGLLNGDFMLNELPYKNYRQADFGNIATLSDAVTYFYFYAYTTQEYLFPSITKEYLINLLESSFNLSINIPTAIDFKVFANRAVMTDVHNCTLLDNVGFTGGNLSFARVQADHIFLAPNNLKDNTEYFDNTGKELFWSINAKENKSITLRVFGSCTKTGSGNVYLGILIDANNMLEIGIFNENFDKTITFMPPLGATEYVLCAYVNFGTMMGITGTVNVTCTYQYTSDIGKDIEMIPEKNFLFNCFENLPKITVLQFLKAIALTNGYTLTFEGSNVNFKKLSDFFSVANTFDASDYFIEADQLDFVYLKYQRNFIRYGANTPPYATIEVNDNTLESEGNFLVIENILPTDDDNVQLWDYTDPDKIKIREGVATIPFQALDLATYESFAQFLDEAFVFTAKFKAFRITGAPIYVKQLNGIFLPTEIIERISGTELKEIKLKILKL